MKKPTSSDSLKSAIARYEKLNHLIDELKEATLQIDRFQPTTILNELDAEIEGIKKEILLRPQEATKLEGVKIGLIMARVTVFALATANNRFSVEEQPC